MRYDAENQLMFHGNNNFPIEIQQLFENMFHTNTFGDDFINGGGNGTFRMFFNGIPQQMNIRPPAIIQTIIIPFEKVLMDLKIPIEITRFIQENNIKTSETETIYIDIPRGIDDGELLSNVPSAVAYALAIPPYFDGIDNTLT